jgi:hypothetical protein
VLTATLDAATVAVRRLRPIAPLLGPARQHVRRLLGAPDQVSGRAWSHRLDRDRGILSVPAYLRVDFMRGGSARGARLSTRR